MIDAVLRKFGTVGGNENVSIHGNPSASETYHDRSGRTWSRKEAAVPATLSTKPAAF